MAIYRWSIELPIWKWWLSIISYVKLFCILLYFTGLLWHNLMQYNLLNCVTTYCGICSNIIKVFTILDSVYQTVVLYVSMFPLWVRVRGTASALKTTKKLVAPSSTFFTFCSATCTSEAIGTLSINGAFRGFQEHQTKRGMWEHPNIIQTFD